MDNERLTINKPKDYQILFLDMNSFFASVEQQVRPELRNKPIGVSPYTGSSGCIIAASREAKENGVKICRNGEAKKLCPTIKILEARPALYMIYHNEIKKILGSITPYFEVLSIDEFAIRLTPLDQNRPNSLKMALKIKERIKKEVGDYLTCSIGVGPSKFLAKMAAESKKPDGLVFIEQKNLRNFYANIKLTDLVGINWRMEKRLQNFGINSVTDFYNCSLQNLIIFLKHPGRLWYFRLRGFEVDNYEIKSKTIGHSHVLEPKFRLEEDAILVLKKLVFKAGYRIRKEKYLASGVYVSINFINGENFCVSRRTSSFSDNQTFWQNVTNLLNDCQWPGAPLRLAVGAFNLVRNSDNNVQLSIINDIEKSKSISRAIDELEDNFGSGAVFPASIFKTVNSAPDRIPFGRPRYDIRN